MAQRVRGLPGLSAGELSAILGENAISGSVAAGLTAYRRSNCDLLAKWMPGDASGAVQRHYPRDNSMTDRLRRKGVGTSALQVERILGQTMMASRAGALVLLAAITELGYARTDGLYPALFVVVQWLVLAVAILIGTRWWRWMALDVVCLMALVAAPILGSSTATPAQSPFYIVVLIATIGIGLSNWSLVAALAAALAVGIANLSVALIPGSAYPLANALPDSLTPAAVVLVVWLIARSLRTSAAALDSHHAEALHRSAELAGERERQHVQQVLGGELLDTLAALAADDTIADPGLHAHVRSEARWLDIVVRDRLPEDSGELIDALRDLTEEKARLGMSVTLSAPDVAPRLDPAAVAAVVDACREALTNVHKHAGTLTAAIHVSVDGSSGVLVEVRDAGLGFGPGRARVGTGHARSIRQRLSDAGGRAEIASRPGAGAVVRLWVPDHMTRAGAQ
jgi:hypothetical protein